MLELENIKQQSAVDSGREVVDAEICVTVAVDVFPLI
jgi:hypothetical protein